MKKIYPPKIFNKNLLQSARGGRRVYLDYASTTPICKEAKREMKKLENTFQNPSALYERGVEAKKVLEDARKKVASILNASAKEIIFTGGGTEGNNLVIFGLYNALLELLEKIPENKLRKFHVITSSIEHPSILEPICELQKKGVEVTFVKPNTDGLIDPKEIKKHLRPETFLVSIMYANNEIGTIQPIREIASIVRKHNKLRSGEAKELKSFLHTDASQAQNYLNLNTATLGVDFMTLDSGKVYGPKGVGAIFRRKIAPLLPIIFGGGQEMGLRSGTENISQIAGFAKAFEVANKIKQKEAKRVETLRDYFIKKLLREFPQAKINGSLENRLPNNINFCVEGLDAEFAVFQLDRLGVECSSTSACLSIKDNSSSYVISEISGEKCAKSSLRITLGRYTKKSDVDYCLKSISHILLMQQKIKPT